MRIALIAHANAPWTDHYVREFERAGNTTLLISFAPDPKAGPRRIFVGSREQGNQASKSVYMTRVPQVRRLLNKFAPDVVFAPYLISNGLTAALAWKGPLLVSARGGDVIEQVGHLPVPAWLHGPMVRFICRRATLVHTVADELTDALAGLGVERSRMVCFPVGVEVSKFAAAEGKVAGASARIICTRRQEPVYDNHVLVKALDLLREQGRDFRCTFVGGGSLLEERRAEVERLGLADRVCFTGQVDQDELRAQLSAADIYVSASLSDGTSSSLLEAMAAGVFPVVSRIRANLDWIRDGETGLLFTAGDAVDLARALASAWDDAGRRRSAAVENRHMIEANGNQEKNMQKLLHLLYEVTGKVQVRVVGAGA